MYMYSYMPNLDPLTRSSAVKVLYHKYVPDSTVDAQLGGLRMTSGFHSLVRNSTNLIKGRLLILYALMKHIPFFCQK